jgi:hypothetical protein
LTRLIAVIGFPDRWQMPVEQSYALWSDISQIALDPIPSFVQSDGPLPKDTVKFIHPSFRQAGMPLPADNTLHRLTAGLQVSSETSLPC